MSLTRSIIKEKTQFIKILNSLLSDTPLITLTCNKSTCTLLSIALDYYIYDFLVVLLILENITKLAKKNIWRLKLLLTNIPSLLIRVIRIYSNKESLDPLIDSSKLLLQTCITINILSIHHSETIIMFGKVRTNISHSIYVNLYNSLVYAKFQETYSVNILTIQQ